MKITLNGETTELAENCSVAGLLDRLQIGRERVAVEVNREIIPKFSYDSHSLMDGDQVEIVHFVGGG